MSKLIETELQDLISSYEDTIEISEGLYYCQYKKIRTAELYSNSLYLSGNTDELGREIPFYNIVNFRVTLAKVATDLDIADVQITADNPKHYVQSMLLQKESFEWMKAENFSYFLNKMGLTRPKYGGVLAKKCLYKEDGENKLKIDVVDWRNVITDQVDILKGTIVEKHYMTPIELTEKMEVWDKDTIKDVIKKGKKKTGRYSTNDTEEFNSNRTLVYEITGELNDAIYLDSQDEDWNDDDKYKYKLQRHYVAAIGSKHYALYSEELDGVMTDYYDYLPYEEMPGRALGRGVIEDSEEAQVWTNDSVINEKKAMDLAGRVGIKTNSKNVGNNILEHDFGRIYELEEGKDMNVMNFTPSSLGQYQNQLQKWEIQADKATSTFDANTGEAPTSGTPYSQTALLNQVASKPFDYRREEAGIFITRLFNNWVIPFLIKKLYKEHNLSTDFTDEELEVIDNAFATFEATKRVNETILGKEGGKGSPVSQQEYSGIVEEFKSLLNGTRRYLSIPKGFFDDIESKVTVRTTNEQGNKQAILQSINTLIATITPTFNPQTGQFTALEDPTLSRLIGSAIELSGIGISPASLGIGKAKGATPVPQQQQAQAIPSPIQPQQPVQPIAQ